MLHRLVEFVAVKKLISVYVHFVKIYKVFAVLDVVLVIILQRVLTRTAGTLY